MIHDFLYLFLFIVLWKLCVVMCGEQFCYVFLLSVLAQ